MSEKIQQFVLLWVFLWLVQRLVQSWASHPHSSHSALKGSSSTTRTTSYSLLATLQLRTTTTAAAPSGKALSTPLSQCFVSSSTEDVSSTKEETKPEPKVAAVTQESATRPEESVHCEPEAEQPPSSSSSTAALESSGSLSDSELIKEFKPDPYTRFVRMLKMQLPLHVVEQKVILAGLDPTVLAQKFEASSSRKNVIAAAMQDDMSTASTSSESLSDEESARKERVEPYERMLGFGMPRIAVENKMRLAGLDPADLDGPRSRTSSSSSIASDITQSSAVHPFSMALNAMVRVMPSVPSTAGFPIKRRTSNRKKIHWSTTPQSGTMIGNSGPDTLWNRMHAKNSDHKRVNISSESKQWLEKLFVRAITSVATKPSPKRHSLSGPCLALGDIAGSDISDDSDLEELELDISPPTSSRFAKRKVLRTLLDIKKSQNIAIILARIKTPFPELTKELFAMKTTSVPINTLQSLVEMWPAPEEQALIDQYDGEISDLAVAERFFMCTRAMPRFKEKLECFIFKHDFASRAHELRESAEQVIRGVNQACENEAFGEVLEYIFHLGNLLNFGDDTDYTTCVKSFSISSLAKLSQTKAYEGGTTFLQYVVQSIERDEPQLARFYDQLNQVIKCNKVMTSALFVEKRSLEAGFKKLVDEAQLTSPAGARDPELSALLENARAYMKLYATELEPQLVGLRTKLDELNDSRNRFLRYFEEDESLALDELFGYIADFAEEYKRERQRLVGKKARSKRSDSLPHLSMSPRWSV